MMISGTRADKCGVYRDHRGFQSSRKAEVRILEFIKQRDVMEKTMQHPVTREILDQALSYEAFSERVTDLFNHQKTTNNDNSESKLNYTKLNIQRSSRIDKRGLVFPEVAPVLTAISKPQIWLVLTEGWCGDSAQLLPYIHKMAETNEHIQLKILLRDEHPAIMDTFLTNGSRSIPKLIILDAETLEVLGEWGPRPSTAQTTFLAEKNDPAIGLEVANLNLHKWYAKDKGAAAQLEIATLLKSLS